MPPPVVPGYGFEGASPVLPVSEMGPGVEVVQAIPPGYGAPLVNIVNEMGPGVRPVLFVDGLPSEFDPAWQTQQRMQEAYAAQQAQYAVQAAQVPAVTGPSIAQLICTILSS